MVQKVDKRLDWRDPDMPVYRIGKRNDEPEDTPFHWMAVTPDEARAYSEWQLRNAGVPYWKEDASYFWNKRNKK